MKANHYFEKALILIFTVLIIALAVFSFVPTIVFGENAFAAGAEEESGTSYMQSGEEQKVSFTTTERVFQYVDIIVFSYSAKNAVKSFTFETSDYDVLKSYKINNEVFYELKAIRNRAELYFDCEITLLDGYIYNHRIYAIQNDYGIFTSDIAFDCAIDTYLDYAVNYGIFTEEERQQIYLELSFLRTGDALRNGYKQAISDAIDNFSQYDYAVNYDNDVNAVKPPILPAESFIRGTIKWKEAKYGNEILARGAKVIIYTKQSSNYVVTATTYTDANGGYIVAVNTPSGALWFDVFISVYAEGKGGIVKSETRAYYRSSDVEQAMSGGTTTIDMTIDMTTIDGKAFQISQAINYCADYVKEMSGISLPKVPVYYPGDRDNCYTSRNPDYISITATYDPTQNMRSYASWDVIMHEYGHYVQHKFGNADNVGGTHYFNKNMGDFYRNHPHNANCRCANPAAQDAKQYAMRLAYAEGWATFFGYLVQKNYQAFLSGIYGVADNYYQSYNGSGFWYEDLGSYYKYGELNEVAVICFLFDLFDGVSEQGDDIQLSHEELWELTVTNVSTTLYELVILLYEEYPDMSEEISSILGLNSIAPMITSGSATADHILIEWNTYSSVYYPVTVFLVMFLDDSGDAIEGTGIYAVGQSLTINNDNADFDGIRSNSGEYYHVRIYAYQHDALNPQYDTAYVSSTFSFIKV